MICKPNFGDHLNLPNVTGIVQKYPSTYWHTINCTDTENILIFYEAANEAKPDKNKTHCKVYFIHMFNLCSVCECVHECRHPQRQ